MISSENVEGTDVYDPKGNKIGEIDDLTIDKPSGRVADAVMSFSPAESSLNSGLQASAVNASFSRDEQSGAKAFRCFFRREPAREHKKLRAALPMHRLCAEPSGVPGV